MPRAEGAIVQVLAARRSESTRLVREAMMPPTLSRVPSACVLPLRR